jgi:hypothetical protein
MTIPWKTRKIIQLFYNVSSLTINFLDNNLAVIELCSLLSTFFWHASIFLRICKIISGVLPWKNGWEIQI